MINFEFAFEPFLNFISKGLEGNSQRGGKFSALEHIKKHFIGELPLGYVFWLELSFS